MSYLFQHRRYNCARFTIEIDGGDPTQGCRQRVDLNYRGPSRMRTLRQLWDRWVYWDLGFLVWGALMLIGGWRLMRAGQQEAPGPRTGDRPDAPIR